MGSSSDEGTGRRSRPWTGRGMVRVRRYGNLINLSTPLGLALAVAGGAKRRRVADGIVIAEGYRWRFPIAGAFTVGNVVITAAENLDERLLPHETRHSWQWLACGPFFLPGYVTALGWSWLRHGDLASGNVFERLAGLENGGYTRRPRRPVTAGMRAGLRQGAQVSAQLAARRRRRHHR